jgi:hypothetical protein
VPGRMCGEIGNGIGPRDITVHVELKLGCGLAKGLQASPGMLGDVSAAISSKMTVLGS